MKVRGEGVPLGLVDEEVGVDLVPELEGDGEEGAGGGGGEGGGWW